MVALFYSSRVGGELKVAAMFVVVFNILPKVVGAVSHSIAILCTIFRLVYRVWTHYFWWEDVWAAFALIADGIIFFAHCLAQ